MSETSQASPIDPRIRRTRKMLHESALALAEERDISSITVRDITERAEINRATFYLHYRDKDDLFTQALDTLFAEFTAEDRAFTEAHNTLSSETVPPQLVALFAHLNERPRLFRRLFTGSGATAFAVRLRLFEEQQFFRIWQDMQLEIASGSPPVELRARFATTAVQGAIAWWLEREHPESPEQIATWLWNLLAPYWFEMVARTADGHAKSPDA